MDIPASVRAAKPEYARGPTDGEGRPEGKPLPGRIVASVSSESAKIWRVGTLTYGVAGLVVLFAWLVGGDFALSIRDRGVGSVFQLVLQRYGASDTFTSVLIGSVPAAIALFVSPIVSFKSDRHRGNWGRRIPFLLFSIPLGSVALAGIAFSPFIGKLAHRFPAIHSLAPETLVLFSLAFFWVVYDFAGIVGGSVFGGLLNDVVPQHFLGRMFGAFRVVSLAAGIIFNHWVYGGAEVEYFWILIAIAVLTAVGCTAMCFGVREGEYPPPPPIHASPGVATFVVAAKGYFRECLGHSYYWWLFIFVILCGLVAVPVNSFAIYYSLQLHMPPQEYGDCIATTFAISLILAYPLGALVDLVHPLRAGLVALGLYAIATLWGGFFSRDSHTFAIALIAHGVTSGIVVTTTASLTLRMFPRGNFAQFSSAGGILGGLVGIIFGPALGMILDSSHHAYRYTFFMGSILSILAILCGLVVHAQFMARGGPQNYLAPEYKP